MVAVLRPVRIAERLALSAVPGDLDADVLATFAEDEFVSPASKRRIRQIVADVEAGAPAVATSLRSYTLHRHLCEVADQWSAIALPDLTSEVRERLVTESEDIPALNAAFVSPMRRMTMEFWRPAFFLDEFTIDCRAYERDGDVIFVHRFLRANDGEPLTTSVEWLTTTVNLMANQQTDELVKGEAR